MSSAADIAVRTAAPRVLVLEDVPEDRARIADILAPLGMVSVPIESFEEASQAIDVPPAAIVLSADVRNGFNICHKFRKEPAFKDVPLILTTAKAGPDVIDKHRRLPTRADEYVRKPFADDALADALDRLVPKAAPKVPATVTEFAENEAIPGVMLPIMDEASPVPPPLFPDPALTARIEALVLELAQERQQHAADLAERDAEAARRDGELAAQREENTRLERELDAARAFQATAEALEERLVALEEERDALAGKLESAQSFGNEIEPLRARIAALEEERDDLAARESRVRSDLEQTTQFFERLEAGYKDSLAATQAEKAATDEARDRCEERLAELTEKAAELARLQAGLPALHEAAARAELLAKELAQHQSASEELERLRGQVSTLESTNRELETRIGGLDAANQAQAAQIGEMVRMKRDFTALKDAEAEARRQADLLAARLERIRAALTDPLEPTNPTNAADDPMPAAVLLSHEPSGDAPADRTSEDPAS